MITKDSSARPLSRRRRRLPQTELEIGAEAAKGDHMKKKGRIGSSFDDFLKEEGIYTEVSARAIKRVIVRQLAHCRTRG
jgi:hypothetical protein